MNGTAASGIRPLTLALLLTGMVLAGCDSQPTTGPLAAPANFAKGGATAVTVTAADPDTIVVNRTTSVRILGTGFTSDAKVQYAIAGKVTSKVIAVSVTYKSSTELVTQTAATADAPLVAYDILVTSGGKRGIGVEKMVVVANTIVILDQVPGFSFTRAYGITFNQLTLSHEAVGEVFGNDQVPGLRRAWYWSEGSGSLTPTLLPMGSSPGSNALAINRSGIIAGLVGDAAVLWKPNGAGWDIVSLDPAGLAEGLNDQGETVGRHYLDVARMEYLPIRWDPAGAMTTLPLPAGAWNSGSASAINANGDIAGQVRQPSPGGHIIQGVVWIRGGAGWTPVLLSGTATATGVADRASDGSLMVAAGKRSTLAYVASAGQWQEVGTLSSTCGGSGMNPAGDMAGTNGQGNYGGLGIGCLVTVTNITVPLPCPPSRLCGAVAVSVDRWLAGRMDSQAVLWKPGI